MTNNPKLSVVIPTYGRDDVLVATIKDVLKQDFADFELIIVDQSQQHDAATTDFLAGLTDPRVRYLRTTPPSLPGARNFALEHARAELIIFIDDDVVLRPGFFAAHSHAYQQADDIVAVAGRVIDQVAQYPETAQPLYFDRDGMGHNSFNCPESQFATSFPGGNVSVKKSVMLSVGGFDTSFRGSAVREESDAAYRIGQRGRIYYEAAAELLHLAAPRGGVRITGHYFDSLTFYRNDLLFMIKTVKLRRWPIALAKRYRDALRGAGLGKGLRRTGLFGCGLVVALRYRLWPARLRQREINYAAREVTQ